MYIYISQNHLLMGPSNEEPPIFTETSNQWPPLFTRPSNKIIASIISIYTDMMYQRNLSQNIPRTAVI